MRTNPDENVLSKLKMQESVEQDPRQEGQYTMRDYFYSDRSTEGLKDTGNLRSRATINRLHMYRNFREIARLKSTRPLQATPKLC
jgi:hypothetical protein